MPAFKGTVASAGRAFGQCMWFGRSNPMEGKKELYVYAAEAREMYEAARERTVLMFEKMMERTRAGQGDSGEMILLLESYSLLAKDPDFEEMIYTKLQMNFNLSDALADSTEQMCRMLEETGDDYLRSRSADVRYVSDCIRSNLFTGTESVKELKAPVILAARDISPAEMVEMNPAMVRAILLQEGAVNSHASILAKSYGIPMIVGLGCDMNASWDKREVLVDTAKATVILQPGEREKELFASESQTEMTRKKSLELYRGKKAYWEESCPVEILCNVSSANECQNALLNDAEGIGLFRTEFHYLKGDVFPTEDELTNEYRNALEQMSPKKVVIRTLDIGADKKKNYLGILKEENPALGLRAIRYCLMNEEIFRTQLRALLRASVAGKLFILLPMITSVWEVMRTREILDQVRVELAAQNIPVAKKIPLGVMIETPAAVMIADELAKVSDFFSVGTNDLTQYTLACDRENANLGRHFDPKHPAVLRLLKLTAQSAHDAGIPIEICGELAADSDMLDFYRELKIDVLSVNPGKVLELRKEIMGRE